MSHVSPPSPDDGMPWEHLGRLLARELTADEAAHLERWIAVAPDRQRLVAELHELWAVTEPGYPSRDPEQVLEAIRQREFSRVSDLTGYRLTPSRSMPTGQPLRYALTAAAIAGLVLGGWWTVRAVRSPARSSAAATSTPTEYRTARGQRRLLTLPDGSTVILAPESVLRYAAAYGATNRLVELAGEGYFEVVHDETRPFIVRAGNAVVQDLGTRFVVRAREDGAAVAVAVAVVEGRVALGVQHRSNSEAMVLDRNDVGRVDEAGQMSVRRDVPLDRYLGWIEGRLVFEATPLATVMAELSRWYDADVRLVGAGLAERQLTADFHNEPLSKVLPMVQASLGLELRVSGRQYILSAR